MTTLPVFDYYYSFLKKSSGTWTDFSGMAFDKFEQLNDLNIKHTKSSMGDISEAIAAMLDVKDPKEFMEFAQKSAGPLPAKISAYFKEVYKINSDLLKSGSEYVEAESEEINKVISDQSEEHTSELQSHSDLVCRLLLEKKKKKQKKEQKKKKEK